MNNDTKADATEPVGALLVRGVSQLAQMLADLERAEFDKWLAQPVAAGEDPAPWIDGLAVDAAWQAWKARGALQRPCRGIPHRGCDYLAACGSVCNKCGQQV
jgi:hypothetical protein